MKKHLVLASASPRRKELLEQVGLEFEVFPAKGEENLAEENPAALVKGLALQKALEVCEHYMTKIDMGLDTWVFLGADTVVAKDSVILGKPKDEEDAYRMLSGLQGAAHSVYTGVALIAVEQGKIKWKSNFCAETRVEMYPMNDKEIRDYIASKEPMDKAGAYAIQGKCAAFIKGIVGEYSTVVGLPVGQVYKELKNHGFMRD